MSSSIFYSEIGKIAHMQLIEIDKECSIEQSIDQMLIHNLRDVVYAQDGKHFIFTAKDLLSQINLSTDLSLKLSQLPRHILITVAQSMNSIEVLQLFERTGERYLGVEDELGKLKGVVSYTDVINAMDPQTFIRKKMIRDVILSSHRICMGTEDPVKDVLGFVGDIESAVIVVEEERPVGIVTAKDVLRILREGHDLELPIKNFMTKPVHTLSDNSTIIEVINHLQQTKFKRAVVVDEENVFIGIVTQSTLASFTFNHWADVIHLQTEQLKEKNKLFEAKARSYEIDSVTDPLTGIGNRRLFDRELSQEVHRANRYSHSLLSLIMLDIDFFKKINDKYGHQVGDEVLAGLTRMIRPLLRESDCFCRWGGEEFAIILPGTNLEGGVTLAERIRHLAMQGIIPEISFTISLSVAQYQPKYTSLSFVKQADDLLYQAKKNGRNRVEF